MNWGLGFVEFELGIFHLLAMVTRRWNHRLHIWSPERVSGFGVSFSQLRWSKPLFTRLPAVAPDRRTESTPSLAECRSRAALSNFIALLSVPIRPDVHLLVGALQWTMFQNADSRLIESKDLETFSVLRGLGSIVSINGW